MQRKIGSKNERQVYNSGSLASVIFSLKPQLVSLWSALAGSPIGHEAAIRLFQRRVGHTSHVTSHTSHVTRHTSHVTRHTSHHRHIKDKFKYDAEDPRASHSVFHGIAQWLNQ